MRTCVCVGQGKRKSMSKEFKKGVKESYIHNVCVMCVFKRMQI